MLDIVRRIGKFGIKQIYWVKSVSEIEYQPLIKAQAKIIPLIEARKSKAIMRSPVAKFERVIVKSESTL